MSNPMDVSMAVRPHIFLDEQMADGGETTRGSEPMHSFTLEGFSYGISMQSYGEGLPIWDYSFQATQTNN
jgi:hypothetical protein